MDILTAAAAWHDAGCSVVPAAADGTKRPAVDWKTYQQERPSQDRLRAWFTSGA